MFRNKLLVILLAISPACAVAAEGGWQTALVPDTDLYPGYVADPRRSVFRFGVAGYAESEIPESGDVRYVMTLGGRYGIVRWHRGGEPDRGFQFDVEAAFIGVFDIDHSLENTAWDGVYGALFSWRPTARDGFRFGVLHDSSHVGDEYAERTGRQRIGYTRGEFSLGYSRWIGEGWRIYTEGAWAYERGNTELQKPWRVQFGVEYGGRRRIWRDRLDWYLALDSESAEESDWEVRTALQIGLAFPRERGARRVGIEIFHGRSVFGEFFTRDETYATVGWWFDW